MAKSLRLKNQSNNIYLKSPSLNFLNTISSFKSTENVNSDELSWRDSFSFNPVLLGRGHFSKVYKAKCLLTGKYFAVKVIRRRRIGVDKINDILQEIEIMERVNKSSNSAFIKLITYHISNTEVSIILEFASGGSIYSAVKDSETGLPELYSRIILSKIITALGVMHEHNIVHLDIKADNILLRYPYPSTDVAVGDFGLARKLSKTEIYKEMIGTPDYIAPEVTNYDNISTKSDMWSVGVLTYFILTNISPFFADTKEETMSLVSKGKFEFRSHLKQENYSLACDFISHLLIKSPTQRFNVDECLNHDFLSSLPSMECLSKPHNINKNVPTNISKDPDSSLQFRKLSSSFNFKMGNNIDNVCFSEEFLNKKSQNIITLDSYDQDILELNRQAFKSRFENKYTHDNTNINVKNEYKTKFGEDLTNVSLDYQVKIIKEKHTEARNNNESSLIETDISSEFSDLEHSSKISRNAKAGVKPKILNSNFDYVRSTKENYNINENKDSRILLNVVTNKTKIYDSRKRNNSCVEKPALGTSSFRNSRNNLLDRNYSLNYYEEIPNYRTDQCDKSRDQKYILSLRNDKYKVKKRTLTRSVKRDFDKPLDNSNKMSQIFLKTNHKNNMEHNNNQKNIILSEMQSDYTQNKSSGKFAILYKSKKHKNEEKKNWKCIIS